VIKERRFWVSSVLDREFCWNTHQWVNNPEYRTAYLAGSHDYYQYRRRRNGRWCWLGKWEFWPPSVQITVNHKALRNGISMNKLKICHCCWYTAWNYRLSRCKCKASMNTANNVLVHTGQNYDYEWNEIFFRDLGYPLSLIFLTTFLNAAGNSGCWNLLATLLCVDKRLRK